MPKNPNVPENERHVDRHARPGSGDAGAISQPSDREQQHEVYEALYETALHLGGFGWDSRKGEYE